MVDISAERGSIVEIAIPIVVTISIAVIAGLFCGYFLFYAVGTAAEQGQSSEVFKAARNTPATPPCAGGDGTLPGELATSIWRETHITALIGGGGTTGPIAHEDIAETNRSEKDQPFLVWRGEPAGQWFIQTPAGDCNDNAGQTEIVHADGMLAQAQEFFRLYLDPGTACHALLAAGTNDPAASSGADRPAVDADATNIPAVARQRSECPR